MLSSTDHEKQIVIDEKTTEYQIKQKEILPALSHFEMIEDTYLERKET